MVVAQQLQRSRAGHGSAATVPSRPLRLHVGAGLTFGRPSVRPQRWFSRRLSAWVSAPGRQGHEAAVGSSRLQASASRHGGVAGVHATRLTRRPRQSALYSYPLQNASSCGASSGASGGSLGGGRGPWGSLFEPGARSRRSHSLVARAHLLQSLTNSRSASSAPHSSVFGPPSVGSWRSRASEGAAWRRRAQQGAGGGDSAEDELIRQLESQVEALHAKQAKDMEEATKQVRAALDKQTSLRGDLREESNRAYSLEHESAAARNESELLRSKLEGMSRNISRNISKVRRGTGPRCHTAIGCMPVKRNICSIFLQPFWSSGVSTACGDMRQNDVGIV